MSKSVADSFDSKKTLNRWIRASSVVGAIAIPNTGRASSQVSVEDGYGWLDAVVILMFAVVAAVFLNAFVRVGQRRRDLEWLRKIVEDCREKPSCAILDEYRVAQEARWKAPFLGNGDLVAITTALVGMIAPLVQHEQNRAKSDLEESKVKWEQNQKESKSRTEQREKYLSRVLKSSTREDERFGLLRYLRAFAADSESELSAWASNELVVRKTTLEARLTSLRRAIKKVEDRLRTAEENLEAVQKRRSLPKSRLAALQAHLAELRSNRQSLEDQRLTLDGESKNASFEPKEVWVTEVGVDESFAWRWTYEWTLTCNGQTVISAKEIPEGKRLKLELPFGIQNDSSFAFLPIKCRLRRDGAEYSAKTTLPLAQKAVRQLEFPNGKGQVILAIGPRPVSTKKSASGS